MSDQTPKRRGGNPAWTPGCPSPNPAGRPRAGLALSERIRERLSPDELIDLAMEAMADPKIDLEKRISIAFQLSDRAYQRPTTTSDVNVTSGPTANYEHLAKLPLDERRALLARLRGESVPSPALTSTPAPRLHEPSVPDDTGPSAHRLTTDD